MGAWYTWFLANGDEFAKSLSGWQMPREPVKPPRRQRYRDPFTGRTFVGWEYEDLKSPVRDSSAQFPEHGHLHHFTSRLDLLRFSELLYALTATDADKAAALLFALELTGPDDADYGVYVIPEKFVAVVAAESGRNPAEIAEDWALSRNGNHLSRLLGRILRPSHEVLDRYAGWFAEIHGLAKTARETKRRMYMLWMP